MQNFIQGLQNMFYPIMNDGMERVIQEVFQVKIFHWLLES